MTLIYLTKTLILLQFSVLLLLDLAPKTTGSTAVQLSIDLDQLKQYQNLQRKTEVRRSKPEPEQNGLFAEGFLSVAPDKATKSLVSNMNNGSYTSYTTRRTTCETTTKSPMTIEISVEPIIQRDPRSLKEDSDDINDFLEVNSNELMKNIMDRSVTIEGSATTDYTSEETSTTIISAITSTLVSTQSTTAITEDTSQVVSLSSTSATTSTTTRSIETNVTSVLQSNPTFLVTLPCPDGNKTLEALFDEVQKGFTQWVRPNFDSQLLTTCGRLDDFRLPLEFPSFNDINTLSDLYKNLSAAANRLNISLSATNLCGSQETRQLSSTVSSCFLIDSCGLCGLNPQRGVCLPDRNVTRCQCFVENNGVASYSGDFCESRNLFSDLSNSPVFSQWPITVGIISSLAGIFLACTIALVILMIHRSRNVPDASQNLGRIWTLPRANLPTDLSYGSSGKTLNDTNSINSNANSLIPSEKSPSSMNQIFFDDLDEKLKGKYEPSETWSNSDVEDPIFKLDSIIDNEDLSTTFHDALDDFDGSDINEFHNPNFTRL